MRFLLLFLLSFTVYANQQPEKESTSDLRNATMMFSIADLREETLYWLERTPNSDYFLRFKEGKEEKLIKVSSREAAQLEREFASKFLKCLYELPPPTEGCKVTLRLNMKGEGQDICEKDERKTQEIDPFFKILVKRF